MPGNLKKNLKAAGVLLLLGAIVFLFVRGCNQRERYSQRVQELQTQKQNLLAQADSLRQVAREADTTVWAKVDSSFSGPEEVEEEIGRSGSSAMSEAVAESGGAQSYSDVTYDADPERLEGQGEETGEESGGRVRIRAYGQRYRASGWANSVTGRYSLDVDLLPQRLEVAQVTREDGIRETLVAAGGGRVTRLSSSFSSSPRPNLSPESDRVPPRWRFSATAISPFHRLGWSLEGHRLFHLFDLGSAQIDARVTARLARRPPASPPLRGEVGAGLEVSL